MLLPRSARRGDRSTPASAQRTLRVLAGTATVAVVGLTVTGGSLAGQASTSREAATSAAVADVWRIADGTALAGGDLAVGATSDPLLAELAGSRDEGSASRSADRSAATGRSTAGVGAVVVDDLVGAVPGAEGQAGLTREQAVSRAQDRLAAVSGQQAADSAAATQGSAETADGSAARVRAAVAAAEADRAAQAEAAALAAAQADPRGVARPLVAERGWDEAQFGCLDRLWTKESGWRWDADNPTSSAYGIPQSLPGEKMASHGEAWATDPRVQVAWGLQYIADVYGTPCRAWGHSQAVNWY